MRIGIDCRTMLNPVGGERAGVGHYTFHLVKALLEVDRDNEYVLYFDHRIPVAVTDDFMQANVTIRRLPFSRYRKFLPFAYAHVLFAARLVRDKLDVFHAPANVMPLSYNRPTVLTIHDLAIYEHPEWFPKQIASTKLLVPQSVKKAAQVIAVSQATKRDVIKTFKLPETKVTVVHEAADTTLLQLHDSQDDIRKKYALPKKYVLYVGTIDPRKNLDSLVEAWQQVVLKNPVAAADAALVIAGGAGYRGQEIVDRLEKLKVPSVHFLGYVSHNHKVLLMKSATAFVFPTLYEGFGLPVLEAMQLGTPVISTNVSSIPEIAGQAATFVAPNDVDALAQSISTVLTQPELANKMSVAGHQQAKNFSWDKSARETLAVYKKASRLFS